MEHERTGKAGKMDTQTRPQPQEQPSPWREEPAARQEHDSPEFSTIVGHLLAKSDVHHSEFAHHTSFRKMPVGWHEVIADRHVLATEAGLPARGSIVMRVGKLILSSGTSGYRVEETMRHVGSLLGVSCNADVSLVDIDATISDGRKSFTQVVSLPSTGVNTERIQLIERLVDEIEDNLDTLTVGDIHDLLDRIEHRKPRYAPWQHGLAAAFACSAFVFLLGGGLIEMAGAFVGAGVGSFVRSLLLRHRINQYGSAMLAVALAGLLYLGTLWVISLFNDMAFHHEAGYIGAMLFVIPGFPLITSGLDLAKNNFTSGIERFVHAITIVGGATIAGWMVAKVIVLTPDEFAPLGLDPFVMCLLRMVASFVGVFGFSIMFNSTPRMALAAGLIGAVSNTARLEMIDLAGMPPEAAALLGATISGLIASVVGLRFALPRISLTVPSIVIMIPGLYLYRAMYYMGDLNMDDAVTWGLRAFVIILCLPIGLAIARMLTDRNWRYDR